MSVRYDLWDEVYRTGQLDAGGEAPMATLPSRDALQHWWGSLVLSMWRAGGPGPTVAGQARVTLQVLPFSQAEQRDAQDWLLRSFRGPESAASDSPPVTRPDAGLAVRTPVRDFYGAMLASSIGRRSLITYSWTVPVGDSR